MNAVRLLLRYPSTVALGWTLIHFIWQGAMIAALLGLVNLCLRKASATARYAAASGALLLMLASSVASFLVISSTPVAPSVGSPDGAGSVMHVPLVWSMTVPPSPGANAVAAMVQSWLSDSLPWLVCVWSAGVLLLSVRSVGGWLVAQRLRTAGCQAADSVWLERLALLGRRLRVSRPVTLCVSTLVKAPSVIGWLRPAVL